VSSFVVDVALEARQQNMPVIAVVSLDQSHGSAPLHGSGSKLPDVADVVIDKCTPGRDALVSIPRLRDSVGPGFTIGAASVTNALKCRVAEKLVPLGKPPIVLTSRFCIGVPASQTRFEDCYDDYRDRVQRVYGVCR
jgi:uncharacterized phosphosugar-binding protein